MFYFEHRFVQSRFYVNIDFALSPAREQGLIYSVRRRPTGKPRLCGGPSEFPDEQQLQQRGPHDQTSGRTKIAAKSECIRQPKKLSGFCKRPTRARTTRFISNETIFLFQSALQFRLSAQN